MAEPAPGIPIGNVLNEFVLAAGAKKPLNGFTT